MNDRETRRYDTSTAFQGGFEPAEPPRPKTDIVLHHGGVIRRRPRPPKLPEPEHRWVALVPTTPEDHIYGLDALRIIDPRGLTGGDWHKAGNWQWIATHECPPEEAHTSHTKPELDIIEELFGIDRVHDVKRYFVEMQHPDAEKYDTIWASAHERGLVENAWRSLHAVGTINGRGLPLRERCRWVRSGEPRDWCFEALDRLGTLLTGQQRQAWRKWTDEWRYAKNEEEEYPFHPFYDPETYTYD